MLKIINRIIVITAGTYFISCIAAEEIADKEITMDRLLINSIRNETLIRNYDVFGSITFESTDESNSGSITLCVFRPDTMYVKIQGPFGITAAVILISKNEFVYYNVLDNYVIKGPPTPINIGVILRFRTDVEFLTRAISGALDFGSITKNNSVLTIDGNRYLIVKSNDQSTELFYFRPGSNLLSKYLLINAKDELEIELNYDNYKKVSRLDYPFTMEMINHKTDQRIKLDLTEVDVNISKFRYTLQIPNSAIVREWN